MKKQNFGFRVYEHVKLDMQKVADSQGITRTVLLENWVKESMENLTPVVKRLPPPKSPGNTKL